MTTIKLFTDIPQSKKLAEFLPLESADNVIVSFGCREGTKTVVMPKKTLDIIRTPFSEIREIIPCWSLASLLGVLPSASLDSSDDHHYRLYCMERFTEWYDNSVDACYGMIIKLKELNLL